MQSNGHNEKQWDNVVGTISKWLIKLDILYFADSLGNMNPWHEVFGYNYRIKHKAAIGVAQMAFIP